MATAKIQLRVQLAIERARNEPLWLQLVRQLQEAIEAGQVTEGTRLPSTRSLAGALGVSRNTVLRAYEELVSRGFVRSRRGAAASVSVPAGVRRCDLRRLLREAQYPSRTITLHDPDGNLLHVS